MGEATVEAVSVAILHRGRFLLVRRGRAPALGLFAFPGGRVEPGETTGEAVRREAIEETGVEPSEIELFTEVLIEAEPDAGHPAFRLSVFRAAWPGGTAVAGDDAAEVGWYSPVEMEALPMTGSTLAVAREIAGER